MSRPISIVLIGWALFSPPGAGQLGDLGAVRDAAIVERLEYLASGQWHPLEKDPAWTDLLRALNEELARKPLSRVSAAARQAAAPVDVEITPIIARRNDDLSVQVEVRPRFVLDMAIPYVAEVYASLDGGAWFRIGVFRDGRGCGTKLTTTDFWPTKLADGIHHVDLWTDIAFLSSAPTTTESPDCGIPKRNHAKDLTPVNAVEVIQRERRVLPSLTFGVFAGLLGAPTAPVNTLEEGLSETSLDRWLKEVLSSLSPSEPDPASSWFSEFCEPEESIAFVSGKSVKAQLAARRKSRAICLSTGARLPEHRTLFMRIRVGTVNEEARTWSIEAPSVYEISIGGLGNVLDIPFLSLLPRLITLPAEAFPSLDISIQPGDILYKPVDAKPGEPITITATIRNVGERDGRFISGILGVKGGVEGQFGIAHHDFLVDIPARGSSTVTLSTTMPPWGWIAVNIDAMPANAIHRQGPYSQLRDSELENNQTFIEIGNPPSGGFPPP